MSNINNIEDILKKSYFDLTPTEHEALAQQGVREAIARMHSKGIPTVEVDENDQLYHRYPDGGLVPIKRKEDKSSGQST